MSEVEEHYENLLADHYMWMRGDYDSQVTQYRTLFGRTGISPRSGGRALDLGAGSGFQSVALSKIGFWVLAADTSEKLLGELRIRAKDAPISHVRGDIRDPASYRSGSPFEVAVCAGDTLTHLQTFQEVEALFGSVRETLEVGGKLVLEFRDLGTELKGAERAIPVRLDENQIMATFLEYELEHVNVHDLIFVKEATGWNRTVSSIGAKTYGKPHDLLRRYPHPVTLWRWRSSRIPRMPSWRRESSAATA